MMQNTCRFLINEKKTLYAKMHLQLDTLGGIAGDMFIAAILDAWPEYTDDTLASIRSAGISTDWQISVPEFQDGVFRGKRFLISEPRRSNPSHHHRYEDIVDRLCRSPLDSSVCKRAIEILELLAEAEADVHGVAIKDVTFHELGAWDSIGDVVGAAYLIETIAPASWSLGPVPIGGGRIETAHGPMPVPAPATARLLQGFTMIDDGIQGERVTPTGAAILRYLAQKLGMPQSMHPMPIKLCRVGTGFGTRTLPGISNICRVLAFECATDARIDDQIGVINFEIDDQTAEDLALGIDALRDSDGVLDVLQMPAVGKKGRMIFHVQVLCRLDVLDQIIDICFLQTTTIGLRWRVTARAILERDVVHSRTDSGSVAVKRVIRPDGTLSAKADADSMRERGGFAKRKKSRSIAEQTALRVGRSGEKCRSK